MLIRKPQFCTLCNKDLKFKYKPDKSWNIAGYLCSDCHMKMTREFMIKQKEEEEKINKKQNQCFICNDFIDPEKKRNLDGSGLWKMIFTCAKNAIIKKSWLIKLK